MDEKFVTPMIFDTKEIKKILHIEEPQKQKIEEDIDHDYYEISRFFLKKDFEDFIKYETSFKEILKDKEWNKLSKIEKLEMVEFLITNLESFQNNLLLVNARTLCYILMGVPCEGTKDQLKMIYSIRELALETNILEVTQNLFLYYSYQIL